MPGREFTVERGRGYVPAQMNKQDGDEIGRIPVDSIYSPVLKVSYKVNRYRHLRIGLFDNWCRADFDAFCLGVELAAQAEELDKRRSCGRHGVTRGDSGLGLHVQNEPIEVGALFHAIPGAAVTSVRISGALHEFTTLPGVEEDVTEILLNIKLWMDGVV